MHDQRRSPTRPRLRGGDDGQALVEYALVLFLVAFVCVTVLAALGDMARTLLDAVLACF